MTIVALGAGLFGVHLMAEVDGLGARLVDDARESGPARTEGGQQSGGEEEGTAKVHDCSLFSSSRHRGAATSLGIFKKSQMMLLAGLRFTASRNVPV